VIVDYARNISSNHLIILISVSFVSSITRRLPATHDNYFCIRGSDQSLHHLDLFVLQLFIAQAGADYFLVVGDTLRFYSFAFRFLFFFL
jgi:hypothetical protein